MLKFWKIKKIDYRSFSHLKNLSMLKYFFKWSSNTFSFSHLKNLSMLKLISVILGMKMRFSHLKNLSMLKSSIYNP